MRYLHSLDPTLFANSHDIEPATITTAEIYLKLSLLMGFQIRVSEPQAFISLAALPDIAEIADAWGTATVNSDLGWNPIVFGIQSQYPSLADSCAAALDNQDYILPWAPETHSDRIHLASLIREKKFDEASAFYHTGKVLMNIESLDRYSKGKVRRKPPKMRGDMVSNYLADALTLARSDSRPRAHELADLLDRLFASGVPTNSRSEILQYIRNEAYNALARDAESLVNDLYNNVEAICLGANSEITNGTIISDEANDDVAVDIARQVRANHNMTTGELIREVTWRPSTIVRTIPWSSVHAIITQKDWQISAASVISAFELGDQNRYIEALHKHIEQTLTPEIAKYHWTIRYIDRGIDFLMADKFGVLSYLISYKFGINPIAARMTVYALNKTRSLGPKMDTFIVGRQVTRGIKSDIDI